MTQQQIEQAVKKHANAYCPDENPAGYSLGKKTGYIRGFKNGANWRINSVWHDKHTVIPEAGRPALLELKDPDTHKTVYKIDTFCGEEWRELTHYEHSGLVRFAYIDDLLPQGKEEK